MRRAMLCLIVALGLPGLVAAQDRLAAAQVPQIPERLRGPIQADYDASNAAGYVLAVGAAGRGWASHDGRGAASPAERLRSTLQRCEHFAQDPCILVMADGRLTRRTAPEPRALAYPERFDAAAVPFVNDAARQELAQRYAAADNHRALALTRNGAWAYVTGQASAEQAEQRAMERCRSRGEGNQPCFVYSVNERVRFTPQTDITNAIRPRP